MVDTVMNPKKIGERLRELRGKRTLQAVAEKLGISTSALNMYELGERIPRDEIKIKLSKFYNVSIDIFFEQ